MEQQIKAMRDAVNKLAETIPDATHRSQFLTEQEEFHKLFARYLVQRSSKQEADWDKIKTPSSDRLKNYGDLSRVKEEDTAAVKSLLEGLVVLKLNGGLGTTMGCTGPKSVITVRNDLTFLDLIVKQIEALNSKYNVQVPLVLMNSFNTDADTEKIIQKYKKSNVQVHTFNQKQFPRIIRDSLLPLPKTADPAKINVDDWFPPGHGDVFDSFYRSPLYKELVGKGKRYMFISNVDNLGATVDLNILNFLEQNKVEFCMEVTKKTRADVKGGTLIDYEGKIKLLELAQVPKDKVSDFTSIKKFKIFNTNNMWIHLPAIEKHLNDFQKIEIIINQKVAQGHAVLQLETAAGAAIQLFSNSVGIVVERSRFLPVKGCSDLLFIQSNLYRLESDGRLVMNPLRGERMGDETLPAIKFGDEFKKVGDYLRRFESIPDILELEHLTVTGDVHFGRGVTLKGNVIIVPQQGARIDIPAGSVLENKVVSGGLRVIDMP